jgi:hypothetical protein
VSIARLTADDIEITAPVTGVVTSQLLVGDPKEAYVTIYDLDTDKYSLLIRDELGLVRTVVIPGEPVDGNNGRGTLLTRGLNTVYVPYTRVTSDDNLQYYVAVINTFAGPSLTSVELPAGTWVMNPVVIADDWPVYTAFAIVSSEDDGVTLGTTSMVNLTTGAVTAPVKGQPLLDPYSVVFRGGDGYLFTTDDDGVTHVQKFNPTTPDGDGFTVVNEKGSPVPTEPRATSPNSTVTKPIVFDSYGDAYITILNLNGGDLSNTTATVFRVDPNGVHKVLTEQNAIASAATVAPNGTVYVSVGIRNAAGNYDTTVRVIVDRNPQPGGGEGEVFA